jgi:hypothetical protein
MICGNSHQKLTLLLLMAFLIACSPKAPQQTPLMEKVGVEDVTRRQLRLIDYGFATQAAGVIELAAYEIQESAESPEIRENAILWKLNMIPLFYQSSFNPDPLGALTSSWALCVQMRQFFTTGEGRGVFGDWQDIAVNASHELEADVIRVAASVLPETHIPEFKRRLEIYAENNPITNLLFVRLGDSTEFLKAIAGEDVGGLAAAASMHDQMRTINDRTALYTRLVPRQVQWHTELMLARAPEFVAEQHDSVVAELQRDSQLMLDPLLSFIEKERGILMKYISSERSAITTQLADERIAALQTLAEERIAVLEKISEERNNTFRDLNALTLASLERMFIESEELAASAVDRVFWRAVQMLALPFVLLIVVGAIALLMIRNWIQRYLRLLEASAQGPRTRAE